MDNRFRSAAIGGFHRQDVINYLEQSAREYTAALDQLRAQLEQEQAQGAQLRDQLQSAREELSDCRAQLEQAAAGQRSAQQTSQKQADRLTVLEQENARLRERLAQVEPDAAVYATIKERTAGMELDAHRRAQAIVDQARAEGQQQRRSVEQWLERLHSEYGEVCAQVESTMNLATLELDRARVGLERVSQCLDSKKGALEGLTRTFDSQSHQ
ncbi:MAG: hypothetical protein J6Q14_02550 [Oscillospiraceae bacterium]|nr:hypothetical protein [Oscillospiraceae bacterium]